MDNLDIAYTHYFCRTYLFKVIKCREIIGFIWALDNTVLLIIIIIYKAIIAIHTLESNLLRWVDYILEPNWTFFIFLIYVINFLYFHPTL